MDYDPKLLALLDVVIDNYICKGEPVGSKFLYSLGDMEYAPSTLRKYLNLLEKAWMVYQPYNSSGRIPTVQWLSLYIENYLTHEDENKNIEIKSVRNWLKYLVETMWSLVDGVVVWFLKNDEYYYLGINNLLRDDMVEEYQTTRDIIRFIEEKRVVKFIDSKITKRNQIYYSFVEDKNIVISCLYAKITIDDYDCVISVIWPTRVDYKKNLSVLRRILENLWI